MKKSINLEDLRHMIKSALLVEKLTAEAKKEEPTEEPTEDTEETGDTEGATEETGDTEGDANMKAVQDGLNAVMDAAQKLGDEKLIDQIGNTITFFTRTHVSKAEKPTSEETPVAENNPQYVPGSNPDITDKSAQDALDMMVKENKKPSINETIFPLWNKIKK